MPQSNANFNHVAISVPDAEAAIEWYTKLFGFRSMGPVIHAKQGDALLTSTARLYGQELRSFKLAVLSMGNGVALEIFEFVDPPYKGPKQRLDWNPDTYTQGGFFHICLTVADVEDIASKVVEEGGKQVGEPLDLGPAGDKSVYLQDPWGNVVEVMSCTFEQLFTKITL